MKTHCCGRPLQDALKICAILDLFFDNIQVAMVCISFFFPDYLPEEYYKYPVNSVANLTQTNQTVSSLHNQQENPDDPTEEQDFRLYLAGFGFVVCFVSTISLFYWLFTGAKEGNMLKCKRWLYVRLFFLGLLIFVTLYKLVTRNYYGFDGVVDTLKIYSIYEVYLVKSFIDLDHMDAPILMKDQARPVSHNAINSTVENI